MGVKGLLPCLQSITRTVPLERYRGLTVAVDAMSWLHKGVFACDVKALAKSQRSNENEKPASTELKCINYTINKVEALMKFGIDVILVIDGDSLPSKKEENAQRREERDKAFEKAMAAEKARDSRAARRFYAQSCSVTHKIRYELIKACKQLGIAFLVAPYEADAQMARLAHAGIVDLVVTEDSDMLVYGCPRVLFKVDYDTNRAQEIQLMRDLGNNATPSFRNWTHDMFVFMCIISGCDYTKGVPGIGIKLAHKIVRVHRSAGKIFSALRTAGRMPPNFEEEFWVAFRTFRHQRVFCPSKQQIETLWPITGSNHDASPNEVWPFLGEYIEPCVASKIANGTFHPSKKIAWDEALTRHHGSESMPAKLNDVQIHRRPSSSNGNRNRRDVPREEPNVWHSLVYGSKDDGGHSRQAKYNENEPNLPTQTNGSKRDMFSFFAQNKTREKQDAVEIGDKPTSETRPPLKEIYVGNDDNAQPKPYAPPAHHKDVPIHFHEYASRLVGKTFKPISRKRRKQENDGTKSSKYIQKIWEKCAKVQQPALESAKESPGPEKEEKDEHRVKEAEGVSLFKKDSSKVNASGIYNSEESDYFRVSINETYSGDASQQQHVMAANPGFSVQPWTNDHRGIRDNYQNTYTSDAKTYDDGSMHASHDLSSHSRIDRQKWHPKDDATTDEGMSRVGARYHAQYSSHHQSSQQLLYEPYNAEHLLQPNFEASSFESRHVAFNDLNIEAQHSCVELQGFTEHNAYYSDSKTDLCKYQIGYDGLGLEEDMDAPTRSEFEQLQTVKKKRSDSSRHHYDYNVDPVAGSVEFPNQCSDETYGRGNVVGFEDSDAVLEVPMRSEFEQLQTVKKKRSDSSRHHYDDCVDPLAGSVEFPYQCSDETYGRGIVVGFEGSDAVLEVPMRSEFEQLQTVKKKRSDSSRHHYDDCVDPVAGSVEFPYQCSDGTYDRGIVVGFEGSEALLEVPIRSEFEQLQTVKKKRSGSGHGGPFIGENDFPSCDNDEIYGCGSFSWQ